MKFAQGRIIFDCPSCEQRLGLEPPRFTITMGSQGVTASPEWSCACGIKGRVFRGRIVVNGRISIPPSGAVRAGTDLRLREALVVGVPQPEPVVELSLPEAEEEEFAEAPVADAAPGNEVAVDSVEPDEPQGEDKKLCPLRRSHGAYASQGIRCPGCGRE